MKLTIILMLFCTVLSFGKSYSQNISLHVKNGSLEQVFNQIEKQSGYTFFYKKNVLARADKVNVTFDRKTLEESLKLLLEGRDLSYRFHNKFIIISPKKEDLSEKRSVVNHNIIPLQSAVLGSVSDSTGKVISGASVANLNNGAKVSTSQDGSFSIFGKNGDILLVSSIGYSSLRHRISNSTELQRVTLSIHQQDIDEVVVTALGIKRSEKTLSYQVQKVANEDLTTVKNSNFVNSLTGKVAGAQINASATGPGGAAKVVLRGSKSISLSNNALYVIDGIPMNNFVASGGEGQMSTQPGTEGIADINPDDIESISVMTGPSAAALYGNEGANGVILISTKKGLADKTVFSVNHSTQFSDPLKLPSFQNTYGNAPGSVMSWGEQTDRRFDPAGFFNTGANINNVVSLQTGNQRSQSYFSAGANNATGILPNNRYDRYNFSYRNTSSFVDDKLTLDIGANYIIQNSKNMVSQGQYFNPLPALYLFPRGEDFSAVQLFERYDQATELNTQHWIYGDQGLSIQNPYWTMYRMNRESSRRRYMLTSSLKYNISNELNIVGRINVDNTTMRSTENRNAGTLGILAGPKGRHNLTTNEQRQVYGDLIATYTKRFEPISININAGAAIKDMRMNETALEGDLEHIANYFSIENMNRSVGTFKTDANGLKRQTQSVFANAEIGLHDYLFLTLTGRNDWDSPLAWSQAQERSFFYPSVGLSAVISEMFTLPEWFSYLKTRGSYTKVGNSYSPYLTTLQYLYDAQTHTYAMNRIRPNFFLRPEITTSHEFGVETRFFQNTLSLSATYYHSNTLNQTHTIPESGTEYDARIIQTGDIENRGMEFLLGYQKSWNKFSWSTNLTYSFNVNRIKQLYGREIMDANPLLENHVDKAVLGGIGSPVVRLKEGGSMGDIYMTSDFKRDNNGYLYLDAATLLPSITTLASADYQKIGSLLPYAQVGFRNSFSYKGIRLNVVLSGRLGGVVVSNTQAIMDRYGVSANSATLREQNDVNILGHTIPTQSYLNVVAEGTGKADLYVYKADNVRLQELSLEYTLNKKLLANIANTTIGITGNNLALLYNKAPFDPEAVPNASSTFYTGVDFFMQPSLRNIGFHLKFQF